MQLILRVRLVCSLLHLSDARRARQPATGMRTGELTSVVVVNRGVNRSADDFEPMLLPERAGSSLSEPSIVQLESVQNMQ